MQKRIRGPLNSTDRLVVEHNHVSPHRNRRTGQGENSIRHVLLPKMADEVNQTEDLQRLQRGLSFLVGVRKRSRGPKNKISCQPRKRRTQMTHVSRAISIYDAPMASANTLNKANVCFGLAISWYQFLKPRNEQRAPLTRRWGPLVQHTSQSPQRAISASSPPCPMPAVHLPLSPIPRWDYPVFSPQ